MDNSSQTSRRSFLGNAIALSSIGLASRLNLLNLIESAKAQPAAPALAPPKG